MSVLILSKKNEDEYRRLVESLRDLSIPATIYHPDKFDVIVGKGTGYGIKYDGQEFDMPDLVLTRTGSGTTEFITALARQFEEEHIRCINSSLSVEIAKDKMRSHQLLASHGLPIPNTMLVRFPVEVDIVDKMIGWPCVVKVISGSYGEGIYLCENKTAFKKMMEFVGNLDTPKILLVQEYVDTKPGEDLRVFVIGGKVIGAMTLEQTYQRAATENHLKLAVRLIILLGKPLEYADCRLQELICSLTRMVIRYAKLIVLRVLKVLKNIAELILQHRLLNI